MILLLLSSFCHGLLVYLLLYKIQIDTASQKLLILIGEGFFHNNYFQSWEMILNMEEYTEAFCPSQGKNPEETKTTSLNFTCLEKNTGEDGRFKE